MTDDKTNGETAIGDGAITHDSSRRGFIRLVAGSALVAPLAVACSGSDGNDGPDTNATEASTAPPSSGAGSGGGSGGGSGDGSGGGSGDGSGGGSGTIAPAPAEPAAGETWNEPWIWRPSDWPGQQLDLNVVENENPGAIVGFGNQSAVLFSYNGSTPGPTIRMSGDETLLVRLRNHLGLDRGSTYVGPYPDPAGGARPPYFSAQQAKQKAASRATALGEPQQPRDDFCLGEHTNGVHSLHVTNLHTHGLHVRPGRNPDGTHSDNVILRLTNQSDFQRRQASALSPACEFLRSPDQDGYLQESEQVGFADYEIRLGDVEAEATARLGLGPQAHPPGTHWYHPHAHGATHNQVASGMAGFLIVEGDVDEAINYALTGRRHIDPQSKTGHYGYIERLMFIQRVSSLTNPSRDSDSGDGNSLQQNTRSSVFAAVNGDQTPRTIVMQPGDIERWRVLNGSVDGRGYKRVMALRGEFQVSEAAQGLSQLTRKNAAGDAEPVTRQETEDAKVDIAQLAFDGVTLVTGEGDEARYAIKDLSIGKDDPANVNPLDAALDGNIDPNLSMLQNIENCFVDADAVRRCYVRPNEVYMAPANRTDILFRAPQETGVYTVLAKAVIMHGDNYEANLQSTARKNRINECDNDSRPLANAPEDIVVAYVRVEATTEANAREELPAPDPDDPCKYITIGSVLDLNDCLPPLPRYLRPVDDDEVEVTAGDPDADLNPGAYRTRTITYSGWGSADFPLVTTVESDDPNSFQDPKMAAAFRTFVTDDQSNGGGSLEDLVYTKIRQYNGQPDVECKNGSASTSYPDPDRWEALIHNDEVQYVLLPSQLRTMAITASTSTEAVPGGVVPADRGRKFSPNDPQRPKMLSGTAEEWVLRNDSMMLWANVNPDKQPIGQFGNHYSAVPLTRAQATERRAEDPDWEIVTKGVDHPFHIHQNPCWVMRIEIPDADGNLVNILDEPRWQDVIWIPRQTGRVVSRSRFPDFIGEYVEHCHLLLHEDNGMMQVIEVTPFTDQANYDAAGAVLGATGGDNGSGRHTLDEAWAQSMQFFDPNPSTGQDYPGFSVSPPLRPVGERQEDS